MTDPRPIYSRFNQLNQRETYTELPVYKKEWDDDYVFEKRKLSPPKPGDLVEYNGVIGWIRYINRDLEIVAVGFPGNESDEIDLSCFRGNYTSNGRRHKWELS